MAYCADDNDLYKNAASAMGGNNNYTRTGGPGEYDPNAANNRRNRRAQREATIDETATAGASNGPTGNPPNSPRDNRNIRATSKWIRDLIDRSNDAREKRRQRWEEARNLVSGLTVGNVNRWLHNVFTIGKWFQNQRNALNEWIYKYAQDPKYAHWAQPLAQMFDNMPNLIRAQQNDFVTRQNKLINSLRPTAKRVGYSTRWLAEVLGHYANARHIPEANAELLRSWQREYDTSMAELRQILSDTTKKIDSRYAKSLHKRCSELENQINALQENLENPNKPKGLISAGYTNRQARDVMQEILQKTGVTQQEADTFADALRNEYTYILQKRVDAGLVPPEQLAAFPNFKNYVALLSRNENLQGATNDAVRYDPGSYHRREGTKETPDSAMATLTYYANRAATEIGMQEFATHMWSLKESRRKDLYSAGMRSAKYSTLMRWQASDRAHLRDISRNILDAGGLVLDVPKTDKKTGRTEYERQYIWFDADWQGEGVMKNITGKMLNDAISSNYKIGSKWMEWAGRATSWHGQLFTRFSLGFAPIGGTRDGMERLFHMVNRSYFADNGDKISRGALLKDYITNTGRASRYLMEAMRNPDKMSDAAKKYWTEYTEQGMFQKMTPGMHYGHDAIGETLANTPGIDGKMPTKLKDLLNNPDTKFIDRWVETTGQWGRQGLDQIDKWNDWWQNIASFSQYISLREHGMSASRARSSVLEMMNMQQRGTLTPFLRIISPFVTPTVQSAAAMARTLGLNAASPKDILKQGMRGWGGVALGWLAFSALNSAAREAMGYDDDGNSRHDAMKVRDLTSWLPISLPGDEGKYVKFPIGFGPVRLAQVISLCTDRISRGLMEPEEMAGEVLFTMAKDVVPATNPQFDFSSKPGEFIMQMLTPDLLKPIMEISSNTNYFGSSIANEPREGVARADQGRTSTDPFWHKLAKLAQQYGIMDVPPEHYKHLAQSYGAGPIRVLGAVFDTIAENDTPTSAKFDPDGFDELTPWLRAFGGTMWVGRTQDVSRGLYYDFRRQINEKIQQAGVQLTQPENKGKKIDAAQYRRQVLEESGKFTAEEINDYELMYEISKQLTKINRDFNEQYGKTWYNFDDPDQLREKFREMDALKKTLYARFAQESSANRLRQ